MLVSEHTIIFDDNYLSLKLNFFGNNLGHFLSIVFSLSGLSPLDHMDIRQHVIHKYNPVSRDRVSMFSSTYGMHASFTTL